MRILKFRIRECCVCGTTWNIHLHHVVFRSQGGDDTEANIVGMCEYHHRQIHAMDPLAWESLGAYLEDERPDTLAYIGHKVGSWPRLLL